MKESAKLQAVEIGLTLGFLQHPKDEHIVCDCVEREPEPVTEDDGGSMELLKRNIKWLKV